MISFQINIDKLHILKTQSNSEKKKKGVGFVSAVYPLVIRLRNRISQIGSYLIAGLHVTWKDLTFF